MRPDWDSYFMRITRNIAARATCDRKHVGALLTSSTHRIIATGYNGAPRGTPHCDEVGHEMKDIDGRPSCIRTIHAESNVLDYAGRRAIGGTLYITVISCYECAKRIVNAGIVKVVYGEYYESRNTKLVTDFYANAGVTLVQVGEDPGREHALTSAKRIMDGYRNGDEINTDELALIVCDYLLRTEA